MSPTNTTPNIGLLGITINTTPPPTHERPDTWPAPAATLTHGQHLIDAHALHTPISIYSPDSTQRIKHLRIKIPYHTPQSATPRNDQPTTSTADAIHAATQWNGPVLLSTIRILTNPPTRQAPTSLTDTDWLDSTTRLLNPETLQDTITRTINNTNTLAAILTLVPNRHIRWVATHPGQLNKITHYPHTNINNNTLPSVSLHHPPTGYWAHGFTSIPDATTHLDQLPETFWVKPTN